MYEEGGKEGERKSKEERERNGQRDEERKRKRGRETDFRLRKTPKFSPEELTDHELSFTSASLKSVRSGRTLECSSVRTQMQALPLK